MIAATRPDLSVLDLGLIEGPHRPPGIHVSTIIRDLMAASDPKKYGGPGGGIDPVTQLRFEVGFAFERALELGFQTRRNVNIIRPDPIQVDGIWLSPDGFDTEAWAVSEFKATWKRAVDLPDDPSVWYWIVQIKAYCHALGVSAARLWALFLNGNYKGGFLPDMRVWDLAFQPVEIAENWRMILQHRDFMRRKGRI